MSELRGWVYCMVRRSELTDDLIQEIFLTVYKKADKFEEGSNFKAWVYAIARLKILEASRRPAMREVCFAEDILELLMPEDEPPKDESERVEKLNQCIGKLSPSARQAIILRYRKQLAPPAIADMMKWSVNAINVTLSRARILLRECIERSEKTEMVY